MDKEITPEYLNIIYRSVELKPWSYIPNPNGDGSIGQQFKVIERDRYGNITNEEITKPVCWLK